MKALFKIAAIALAAGAAIGVHAQDYPAAGKTITLIVPFTAGGPTDKVARDLAESMRKHLNNATIVVDNADGAGSTIGTAKAARARPDGYTLLINHIGMSTIPSLYRKLSFNVLNDFEYAGIINDVPMTLIGRPSLPAQNFAEVKDWIGK
ncbi:tripartite tricarboxylate transporter substrate-binding protein, partial [Acinetobacter baumannii]|nr:tripartite tricarboxylate transporter substrate-binding protein [Acinetobacter baumannii]MCW1766313.1 tripartite tricarboxylate transporter substrate-binding protein [Acinetobacter baumannii]